MLTIIQLLDGYSFIISNFLADFPLTKSKSHESELGNRLYPVGISGTSQVTTPSGETSSSSSSNTGNVVNVVKTAEDGSDRDHKHLQTLAVRRARYVSVF